jgi:hypothetical protein
MGVSLKVVKDNTKFLSENRANCGFWTCEKEIVGVDMPVII